MKGTKLVAFVLIVSIFGLIKSVDFPEEESVLVLGDDNFDQAVSHYEFLLVEFYAPWCGHCKSLAPEYAKAAKVLREAQPPLHLAKVDATVHTNLATKFDVQGFPTLKFFTNGSPQDYNGGRTEAEIVSWMKKKTGPATTTFNSAAEVETFRQGNDVVVVYFGPENHESELFKKVAREIEDVLFGTCSSDDCYSTFGVTTGSVVLFKNFDELRNDLAPGFTEETLTNFVDNFSSPLVMKFDEKCAELIFGKATPGLFLYRDKNSENTEALDNMMKIVATKIPRKLQVVLTDIKEGLESRLAEYIGITANDLPSIKLHDTTVDLKKYNMEGEITEENVLRFVDDWENGRLRPSLKSEEVPEKQEGDVYVLVGKSFDSVVMDPTKDVLVEFYAPWCGHCKQLAPIYDELATKLKHNHNLVIAKMDATANEVESVSIQGFPTIKFWPANNKSSPLDFEGDRTVEGFTKYLQQHSSNPVTETKEDL